MPATSCPSCAFAALAPALAPSFPDRPCRTVTSRLGGRGARPRRLPCRPRTSTPPCRPRLGRGLGGGVAAFVAAAFVAALRRRCLRGGLVGRRRLRSPAGAAAGAGVGLPAAAAFRPAFGAAAAGGSPPPPGRGGRLRPAAGHLAPGRRPPPPPRSPPTGPRLRVRRVDAGSGRGLGRRRRPRSGRPARPGTPAPSSPAPPPPRRCAGCGPSGPPGPGSRTRRTRSSDTDPPARTVSTMVSIRPSTSGGRGAPVADPRRQRVHELGLVHGVTVKGDHLPAPARIPVAGQRIPAQAGRRGRQPARPGGLEGVDRVGVSQRQADVVEPLQQPPADVVVHLERHRQIRGLHRLLGQVDGDLGARLVLQQLPEQLDVGLRDLRGQQPALGRVAAEDVGEPGGDHHPEPVVHQRPDGVLARRPGAEVGARPPAPSRGRTARG